jgi:hypothetical protein
MRWVLPAVFVLVVLAFVGFYVLATGFEERAAREREAYAASYSGPYAAPTGVGPEWDKLRDATKQGRAGYKDLQALMASKDHAVAFAAITELTRAPGGEATDLFFEGLPNVVTQTKDDVRSAWYDWRVFDRAADRVKERHPATKKGAMLFLKLSYMRDGYNPQHHAFETLVSAIPDYDGAEADELAYTISLFHPADWKPLVDMLGHESPQVRRTALAAIGKTNAYGALGEVARLKSDADSGVRKAAARAEKNLKAGLSARTIRARSVGTAPLSNEQERKKAKNRLGMP